MAKKQNDDKIEHDQSELLTDLHYIYKTSSLITSALQNGQDVAQLPNGDLIITEIKTVYTQYSWDKNKTKMVRVSRI